MRHRLTVAGADRPLFDDAALRRLHAACGGVPRVLNHLATQCLLEGMARDVRTIDAELVEAVASGQPFLEPART